MPVGCELAQNAIKLLDNDIVKKDSNQLKNNEHHDGLAEGCPINNEKGEP